MLSSPSGIYRLVIKKKEGLPEKISEQALTQHTIFALGLLLPDRQS